TGSTLGLLNRNEEALKSYQRALAIAEGSSGPGNLLDCLLGVGNMLSKLQRHEQAVANLRRALLVAEKSFPATDFRLARALEALGTALSRAGQEEQALAYLERSLSVKEQARPRSVAVADTQGNVGDVLIHLARPKEALAHYQKALEILTALPS